LTGSPAAAPAAPTPVSAQDLLERRCQDLIDAETSRLARRVSALHPDQLTEVASALRRVADQLVLAHADAISDSQLAVLFDLAGTL
jgi:hypothetical protein